VPDHGYNFNKKDYKLLRDWSTGGLVNSRTPRWQCDITIQVGTNGATTLSRMNLSGYAGHVTIFSLIFTVALCLVVAVGLGLGLGLGLD